MQFRGGMNELMRQAARMQRKIDQVKADIKDREVTGTAAGDKIAVVATCEGKVRSIKIDPDFLAFGTDCHGELVFGVVTVSVRLDYARTIVFFTFEGPRKGMRSAGPGRPSSARTTHSR